MTFKLECASESTGSSLEGLLLGSLPGSASLGWGQGRDSLTSHPGDI